MMEPEDLNEWRRQQARAMQNAYPGAVVDDDDLRNVLPGGVIRLHDPDREHFARMVRESNRASRRSDAISGVIFMVGCMFWAAAGLTAFVDLVVIVTRRLIG